MHCLMSVPLLSCTWSLQAGAGATSRHAVTVASAILSEGGAAALYRGLGAASVRVIPGALTSFATYELVRWQVTRIEEVMAMRAARHEQRALVQISV